MRFVRFGRRGGGGAVRQSPNSAGLGGSSVASHFFIRKPTDHPYKYIIIAKVREDMKQTHQLYLAGKLSAEGFGEFYKPLEERLKQLQAELPKLQAEVDYLKVNDLSAEQVLSEANTLYSRWPSLSVEDKRKIVDGIVEKIVIGPGDEIELTLSYLPSSEEMTNNQRALRRQ